MQKSIRSTVVFLVVAGLIVCGIAWAMSFSKLTVNPQIRQDKNIQSTSKPMAKPVLGKYSQEEVTQHASLEKCWAIVEGKVYDLTQWISKHPGGEGAILGICGKDGTEAFTKQHGDQKKPSEELAVFQIGILK